MANYFTKVSVLFPVGSAENVAPALALYQQFANGVSHHEGDGLDGIDYDRDADHVAVAEVEPNL